MSSVFDNNVYDEKMSENEDELSKRQMLDDLQLAAELGNTLLERNKELEKCLRQQQNTVDDQAQEIEYLNKQTVALREVNDSRLRVYEQLEVGIQELELQNHRFAIESANDKKQIKTLLTTIEQHEERYDELQKNFDEIQRQLTLTRRQQQNQQQQRKNSNATTPTSQNNHNGIEHNDLDTGKTRLRLNGTNGTLCNNQDNIQPMLQQKTKCNSTLGPDHNTNSDTVDGRLSDECMDTISNNDTNGVYSAEYNDEIIHLLKELADERAQRTRDQRRVTELEEQMTSLLRQIQTLEQQLHEFEQKEVMTSMHEEISTLEEVRDGHLCGRCLRHVDEHARDELSAMLNQEHHSIIYEDESSVQSLNNSVISDNVPYKTTLSLEIQAGASPDQPQNTKEKISPYERANPYRELVEKYEALLSVEASIPRSKRSHRKPPPPTKSLSLQEELQMSGDFNSLSTKDTDDESGHGGMKVYRSKKFTNSRTPTDFSEAETSSSGFSDETSNKATQTEKLGISIGDDTDKICIYNDAIDSSFQNHPKYRELFKEIFQKLKTGPETKEEAKPQSVVDDVQSDFTDDCQSVTSYTNSEMSTTLIEPVKVTPPKTPEKPIEKPTVLVTPVSSKAKKIKSRQEKADSPVSPPQEDPPTPKHKSEAQIVLTPYKREPLELSLGLQLRKKSSSRKNALRKSDRCESPVLPLSPKILYSSRLGNSPNGRANQKRRDFKPIETPARALTDSSPIWNGDSMQFWSSKQVPTMNPTNGGLSTTSQFLPSTASQDFSKLKKLEVTYAEALRNADKKKSNRMNSGGQSYRRSK